MNELLLVLGLLALVATGCWLAKDKPWRKVGTPEPKVRVRSVRKYILPPAIPPHISVDVDTGQPKVVLKGRRQIALQGYPQVYRPRAIVERHLRPLYQEKGWRKEGRLYRGYYRVDGRRWRGEIIERHRGFYEAFICNPPLQNLRRHPHGPCFNRSGGNGRFKVHFQKMPRDVDHIIVNVETILSEALGYG
jgi:hypothetical protein